jgi:TfoX/Sxy family transcriptional regulator of competence genes
MNSFSNVASAFLSRPGVETSRMFGSEGLKTGGKVLAMQVKGALVLRLSKALAEQLVGSGKASVFDPGHGRPMKQWIAVPATSDLNWRAPAEEAFDLVSTTETG